MASFSAAAKLLASSLITDTRSDGSSFIKTAPDSPDWIRDAIREAHDGEPPNDTRYALIQDCAQAIADRDFSDREEAEETVFEIARDITPGQSSSLLLWFSANTSRLHDCDEASANGREELVSVFDALDVGYVYAAELTLRSLIESIEDAKESIFNPDTDSKLLLSDSHGVYIPQMYCEGMTETHAQSIGIAYDDVLVCQSGPDQECYWESWQAILDSAEITEPATLKEDESQWRLIQSGDLWQVRSDVEIPEEWLS